MELITGDGQYQFFFYFLFILDCVGKKHCNPCTGLKVNRGPTLSAPPLIRTPTWLIERGSGQLPEWLIRESKQSVM